MQLSAEGGCRSANTGNSSVYLLQKWSTTWGTYIDVEGIDDLEDKDKVTVVPIPISVDPRPSSKVGYRSMMGRWVLNAFRCSHKFWHSFTLGTTRYNRRSRLGGRARARARDRLRLG